MISVLIVYTINIETINYKNKNPQVNLMGSNPTPRVLLVEYSRLKFIPLKNYRYLDVIFCGSRIVGTFFVFEKMISIIVINSFTILNHLSQRFSISIGFMFIQYLFPYLIW